MRVLVDTNQLSEEAAAEVEAIAHMRNEERRKYERSVRGPAKKTIYPAPGDAKAYEVTGGTRTPEAAPGTKKGRQLPHDLPMVSKE